VIPHPAGMLTISDHYLGILCTSISPIPAMCI
jgi:hypothetical protein